MKLPDTTDQAWLTDAALDAYRRADRPDEIQVRFQFWEQGCFERLWVAMRAFAPAVQSYVAQLLEQPQSPDAPSRGDMVWVRVAPGCVQPLWMSPAMQANRVRFKGACDACGFDMLLRPAEVIAEEFPEAPEGCVPVKFSTKCDLCGGTVHVNSRV